jgi:hypothetical protein
MSNMLHGFQYAASKRIGSFLIQDTTAPQVAHEALYARMNESHLVWNALVIGVALR